MNYFNINIDEVIKDLRKKAETIYVKDCNCPERDEDGNYPTPSLKGSINSVLEDYFDKNYEEIPDEATKEYDSIYNKLHERLTNELSEEEINESMQPILSDYYGLSVAQRNSEKY